MAGAGFKTFNTGDVLTASDVNTYLMQQTVMVFADSSARSTALGANVAEGMLSYLKDTNAVEVYNGSAWVSSDDPNAIQNTIVDAKGDIITATAADTPARLAVGANGYTLVADSSTSTGLAYSPTFFAGKNKIINGDFRINQRAFSSTTTGGYGFDRFLYIIAGDGTATYSAQTFTLGAAPVAGYEAINYARIVTTGQTTTAVRTQLGQNIEDVRVLAGETATVSFWAKANSGTPNIAVELRQDFGSGGSTAVNTLAGQVTLSTSWTRYSLTVSVPSVSGKTIGSSSLLALNLFVSAGSDFNARTGSLGIQSNTFEFWGVQLEAGSTATQFQTATGTIQGELAACQRYYFRQAAADAYTPVGFGMAYGTTGAQIFFKAPVTMRTAPSSIDYSTVSLQDGAGGVFTITGLTLLKPDPNSTYLNATGATGLTQYRSYFLAANNSTSAYVGISAEL